jgi:hypothetical protein
MILTLGVDVNSFDSFELTPLTILLMEINKKGYDEDSLFENLKIIFKSPELDPNLFSS